METPTLIGLGIVGGGLLFLMIGVAVLTLGRRTIRQGRACRSWPSVVGKVRASDVQTVICDGKVLMRDRELLTLDKKEIVARVGESMERLSRRVPESRIQLYKP